MDAPSKSGGPGRAFGWAGGLILSYFIAKIEFCPDLTPNTGRALFKIATTKEREC